MPSVPSTHDTQDRTRRRRRTRQPFPETSLEACMEVQTRDYRSGHLSATQRAVLKTLRTIGPATDDALYEAYLTAGNPRRTRQRIGTIRSELRDLRLVENTGIRGRSACCQRNAAKWAVIDHERE